MYNSVLQTFQVSKKAGLTVSCHTLHFMYIGGLANTIKHTGRHIRNSNVMDTCLVFIVQRE